MQGRSDDRLASRHSSTNSSLLTRMRRRDSYARAAAAASTITNSASATSTVTVGETGLVESQGQLREDTQQTPAGQSLQQEAHGNSHNIACSTYFV